MIENAQGEPFKYDKSNILSQKMQETLFNEKRIIIEKCLFGADLNPKAVYICQLRLWIELISNCFPNATSFPTSKLSGTTFPESRGCFPFTIFI